MRTTQRLCLAGCVLALLNACGGSDQAERAPPPVEDTAFGDMVGTMDKARAVEATTMQHKEALDRALEQQESGADAP